MAEQAVVARRARADEDGRRERVRELQVHESWLRIEVKPTGLRCVPRRGVSARRPSSSRADG